ncbi:MAG: DoxX family protein [Thiotrichales bacterium]|nr:DoxX family protein [Thiotrichales bacterium]
MAAVQAIANKSIDLLDKFKGLDFLAPLLLRIYLAPIFIKAGYGKLQLGNSEAGLFERLLADPNIVAWFGNPDWGLGLPFPDLLAFMAGWTEFLGGWFLLFGILIRVIAIPLMFTMIVAATTAHWDAGWHALPESKLTVPWEWRTDMIEGALERKQRAVSILKEHSNYSYITEHGSITILKNGIEFAATYFLMLLVLFFTGAGRYLSLDFWVARKYRE